LFPLLFDFYYYYGVFYVTIAVGVIVIGVLRHCVIDPVGWTGPLFANLPVQFSWLCAGLDCLLAGSSRGYYQPAA